MISNTLDCRPLPDGAVMLSLTAPAELAISAGSLQLAGRAASGPWLFHRGRLPDGRQRCTWIGRGSAATPTEATVTMPDGATERPLAGLRAAAMPVANLAAYAGEYRDIGDRLNLLRQLIESAPTILKLKGQPAFERLRRDTLARILSDAPELAPSACYAINDRLRLFLFDSGVALDDVAAVHVVHNGGPERSPFVPVRLAGGKAPAQALLVEAGLAGADVTIALFGSTALHRVAMTRSTPVLGRGDLLGAIGRMAAAGFDLARYLIATLAPYRNAAPVVGDLVRELGLLMPAVAPASVGPAGPVTATLDLALATAGGSLVLGGRLDDPHGLTDHLLWRVPGGPSIRIPAASLHFVAGTPEIIDEPGRKRRVHCPTHFLAVIPVPTAAAHFPQHGVELVLRSGARLGLTSPRLPPDAAGRRDRLLGFLKDIDVSESVLAAVAPVVSDLHAEHLARERVAEVFDIGRPKRRPEISVIVPLYKVLSFLRHQAAAFAFDSHTSNAEFVAVLDSPEQRDELRHVLGGLEALYGLAWRVVVHASNLGYAPAINTGAGQARGQTLVLLNSDVVPADDRWLPALRTRLTSRPNVGAVGPKLLYGDDSLQHAGLTFAADERGRYYNTHFFKGYPRSHPAANRARRVPGLTGACLAVDRTLFASVGGISESYVVGDFEDSDLSLRLAAAGRELWYEPAAELYHYERESITRNDSYADTAACRFNQHIHAARWKIQLQKHVDNNLR